jgi:hypothetical protein
MDAYDCKALACVPSLPITFFAALCLYSILSLPRWSKQTMMGQMDDRTHAPNAQVCVYLMVHYICAKNIYYIVTAKCHRRHAAAYWTTQNAFPYFWSNKSQNLFLKNH